MPEVKSNSSRDSAAVTAEAEASDEAVCAEIEADCASATAVFIEVKADCVFEFNCLIASNSSGSISDTVDADSNTLCDVREFCSALVFWLFACS